MKWEPFVLAALAGSVSAKGVTENIAPPGGYRSGCKPTVECSFGITANRIGAPAKTVSSSKSLYSFRRP
jgi:hypothetical protein